MDIIGFKKNIPKDWEKYYFLPAKAIFEDLKRAIESVEKGHIAIIFIPKNNHFLIKENIDLKGYVSIFCDENVTFTNDRDKAGFTTGIDFKNGQLNLFNGSLITTKKSSYYGFLSGNGFIKTFDTNIDLNHGSLLSAGFLTDVLAFSIKGGNVTRNGKGYLIEDSTGRAIPMVLNATFPNNIDESFIKCETLISNLFLPNKKGGN